MAKEVAKLEPVMGLPFKLSSAASGDSGSLTNTMYKNSIPLLRIIPCDIELTNPSLHFLQLKDASSRYCSLLSAHDYSLSSKYPMYAYNVSGSISESVSNSYGQTQVERLANGASEGIFEARQVFGIRSAEDIKSYADALQNSNPGTISNLVGSAARVASEGLSAADNALTSLGGTKLSGLVSGVARIATGERVDLPSIWKGSSFSSDYTFTITLMNPNPSSDDAYDKFIVGPLVSLLILGMPQSSPNAGNISMVWPFFVKAYAPGLCSVSHGAVKDISITKGGSAGAFDYKQRPTVVEVSITIGQMYDARVVTLDGQVDDNYPTLREYINAMKSDKSGSGSENVAFSSVRHYTGGSGSTYSQKSAEIQSAKNNTTDITKNMVASTPSKIDTDITKKMYSDEFMPSSNKPITDLDKNLETSLLTYPSVSDIDTTDLYTPTNAYAFEYADADMMAVTSEYAATNSYDFEFSPSLNKGINLGKPNSYAGEFEGINLAESNSYAGEFAGVNVSTPYSEDASFGSELVKAGKTIVGQVIDGANVQSISNMANSIANMPSMVITAPNTILPSAVDNVSNIGNTIINNTVSEIIKIGTGSIINNVTKQATLSSSDFASPYTFKKKQLQLEKSGYDVILI